MVDVGEAVWSVRARNHEVWFAHGRDRPFEGAVRIEDKRPCGGCRVTRR